MILFKSLRYKNFLSTGNIFTTINLNDHSTTLIIGANGQGKSTMIDAICFVLYGTAYRNINKPQLVNSITRKGMLVEIDFSIGSNEYMVRRGVEPDIFEIFHNGELVNQMASAKEYQTLLDTTILKMNKKSFCQIVILGTAGYVPFMQLSASDRREIIEDFLDIQIFTKMNLLLKDKISVNKDEIKDNEHDIKLLEQKKQLLEKNEEMLKQNTTELIQNIENRISEYNQSKLELEADILQTQQNIDSNQHHNEIHDKLSQKITEYSHMHLTLSNKLNSEHKEHIFLTDHDHCPSCLQDIDQEFKAEKLSKIKVKMNELAKGLELSKTAKDSLKEKIEKVKGNLSQIHDWEQSIHHSRNQIKSYDNFIEKSKKEIQKLSDSVPVFDDMELKEINNSLALINETKYNLLNKKRIYDIGSVLLKDSGIKTKITKQYIPVINSLINKYLATLDFFVNFELNEQFKEKIKSRYRDDFSYASFSEGEKLRIDVALLFTWRAIAKLRNSASTNLLIMDEIFDSSLDVSGTDEFMKMIYEIAGDSNIFVISHKGDALFDKFQNVIKFEKVKNFSRMVE